MKKLASCVPCESHPVSAESTIFANYIALYSTWAIYEYSLYGLVGFLSNALIKLHRRTLLCASRSPFCSGRGSMSESAVVVYLAQALLRPCVTSHMKYKASLCQLRSCTVP